MKGFLRPSRPNGKPATRSPGADRDYKKIDPYLGAPPPSQLSPSPHATQQQPVRSNRDILSQQQSPTTTPIYEKHAHLVYPRTEKLSRRHSQTIPPRAASIDDTWVAVNDPSPLPETTPVPLLPLQPPPPIPESRTPSAPSLPPGAAQPQPVTYGATPLGTNSNPQSPAGPQSPSQAWSNKPSPAVPPPKKSQPPTMNGVAPPPRTNGHASGNSIQYTSGRPVAESHDNGGEGSIHSDERDKGWVHGFFGSSKEREREKEAQKELTRMIGFLTATASDDWTLLLELCERASASESAAKEAAKALKQEFKYADPPAQLSAARLWAIMLQNSSNHFAIQTATKRFMETVESVILSPTTSPVVRERLMDVLAAAAFTFHGPGREGFQSTWRRVRPPNKPEDGIPFDMEDSMFDPTQGHRSRAPTNPAPQVAYVNTPQSPQVHRPNTRRQDSDQGHPGRQHRGLPRPPRPSDRGLIPPEEDMRRLFEECEVAVYSSRILNEALVYGTPESFRKNPVIKEYYTKCQASHAMIIAQIPWASAGAARSQAKREETPGAPELSKEENLLAALLSANQDLVDVFKCYNDLEVVANAEKEKRRYNRGRAEQKPDATQIQYISPEGVPIPDPTRTQSHSGTSASSREPSPSRGGGRPSNSRELPPPPSAQASAPPSALPIAPPSAYATPTQPRYAHHHSHSNTSVNNLMPPPPAPHGPRLAATHPRSRTPSPERQIVFPPQTPQVLPAAAVSAISAASAVGLPTPSSEPQYSIRHAPPLGPPPLHLNHPIVRQARIDSLQSTHSVSSQGPGVLPSMRVDVGAANSYIDAAGEEDIMTPVRPSEKALGKRRMPLDAEPDEEDLHIREETELEEAMLRSQSPYVNGEEEIPTNKILYVYDAAEERARQLAAEEAAELAALAAFNSRRSLDKLPTRMDSQSSV